MKITSKFTDYQQNNHFVSAVEGRFLIKHLGLRKMILHDVKMERGSNIKVCTNIFIYSMYSCVLLTIFGKIQNLKRTVQLGNSLYVSSFFFLY